jgi:hypothetical protein
LGDINPDKFTTIARPKEDESFQSTQYKFLKRPLYVDHNGMATLGILDFFPSIADVLFPEGDGVHTATPGYDRFRAARTFAMQWGRFLTTQTLHGTPISIGREADNEFILSGIRMAYRALGLPFSGGIPGDNMQLEEGVSRAMTFFCPPCDTVQLFTEHWMEILLFRFHGQVITIPIVVGGSVPPPLSVVEGETFTSTSDMEYLQLMVDLGVLEKRVLTEFRIFDEAAMEEMLRRLEFGPDDGGNPLLCEYTVVDTPPTWWYDVVSYDYPVSLVEDPQEAMDRVSTVMSGSVV